MFKFIKTDIEGVFVIEPQMFNDNRGSFCETYKKPDFDKAGLVYNFVQDNQSTSKKGVLRGLHYQKKHPQAKLVRVLDGEVFDVAVDLRKNYKSYGKWFGVVLSGNNKKMLMIPRGFAHGFVVLSETATFIYKCDELYHPEEEEGIIWNDPQINIEWPKIDNLLLSEKDLKNKTLNELKTEFDL